MQQNHLKNLFFKASSRPAFGILSLSSSRCRLQNKFRCSPPPFPPPRQRRFSRLRQWYMYSTSRLVASRLIKYSPCPQLGVKYKTPPPPSYFRGYGLDICTSRREAGRILEYSACPQVGVDYKINLGEQSPPPPNWLSQLRPWYCICISRRVAGRLL